MDDHTRSQLAEYVAHEGAGALKYKDASLCWEYIQVMSQYIATLRRDRDNW